MEIILAFLGIMILISAFSHGGRQSTSDSVKESVSDSAEIAKDNWMVVLFVFIAVSALFYFGVLK